MLNYELVIHDPNGQIRLVLEWDGEISYGEWVPDTHENMSRLTASFTPTKIVNGHITYRVERRSKP